MPRYSWDKQSGTWVKISDRAVGPKPSNGPSLADQVMQGYRRCEERGMAINGRKAGIKRIWGQS